MAVILADPVMINAYQSGIPGNGKPFRLTDDQRSALRRNRRGGLAAFEGYLRSKRLGWHEGPTYEQRFARSGVDSGRFFWHRLGVFRSIGTLRS
jgi:hypothetical protein